MVGTVNVFMSRFAIRLTEDFQRKATVGISLLNLLPKQIFSICDSNNRCINIPILGIVSLPFAR